jgi:16S rRNA (adenine1518-N6/adenine1519-N6)-dimethyltransferase
MQSKQHIERLLASAGIRPNRRLGQNFLIDMNLMHLLIGAAHINPNDIVLEVGCGTGSFTEGLAKSAGEVISVEIDEALTRIARKQLKKIYNVKIFNADILQSKHKLCPEVVSAVKDAKSRLEGRILLVANLPYKVAATVMMNLIAGDEDSLVADLMCVTVQREVADRMVAAPGSADYGVLSIFMSAAGHVTVMRRLKPSVFWPQPQVDSCMVRFARETQKVERIRDMGFFQETVHLFMGHRRKMMQACVKFARGRLKKVYDWHDIFSRAFVEPRRRPEELSDEEYISIANLCYEQTH